MVWDSIDSTILNTEMPEIYRNYHVNILCRDCHEESKVVFHVIGLKCGGCGGYNTTRIGGDDPLPEEPPALNVENLSVNSDDSLSSWETLYTEEDETNTINANDNDVSITLLPPDENHEEMNENGDDHGSDEVLNEMTTENVDDGGTTNTESNLDTNRTSGGENP